jgi:hypothetical protein
MSIVFLRKMLAESEGGGEIGHKDRKMIEHFYSTSEFRTKQERVKCYVN